MKTFSLIRRVQGNARRAKGLAPFCAAVFLIGSVAMGQAPTPESVLGHRPGDDFYLATYDDALGYFQKLAASSDKVKLVNVGKTTQGRDWYVAFISTPQNLAQLDHYKDVSRRLALARGLTEEQARALARESKAIIHIDGGLHASEVACAQHTIRLAYDLVSSNDPAVGRILDNVIVELWFSLNPDGQNMIANWYRQNVGTPFEVSPMPMLYQEYVGHDNNRDGYMLNMIESQLITRATLDSEPLIFYTHHQTAPFPARIYLAPFAEPISSNMHPLMLRWLSLLGTTMAAYLEEHDMPGALHRDRFDVWYPGFIDNIGNFRHTISFFTETALYRYATPHFYTVEEFAAQRRYLREEMLYASPWKGGWWRLRDAVRYMLGASMAVLETSSDYRETLLFNRYQAGRDTIQRFEKEPPFAYVIPRPQRDTPTAAMLVEKLMLNGIEVHEATRPITVNAETFPGGSWVILMNQPFAELAKEVMEVQRYPDIRDNPNVPMQQPYDVTGWTLPLQMGVEAVTVTTPVDDSVRGGLRKLDRFELVRGKVEGTGSVFTFSHQQNAAMVAANRILAAGGGIAFAKTGDTIVASNIPREKLAAIVAEAGVNATAADKAPADTTPVKAPRVGLYRTWTASIDEGWTRWILERYSFQLANLYNADVQAGHLRDRFDAIILPDQSTRGIMEGFQAGTVPQRYAGGIGETGVEKVREFVEQGGTLVTFNNASLFAIEKLNLPVENALTGLRGDQFFCSGCLVEVEIADATHPVVAGLPHEVTVMFERGPAFRTKRDFQGKVLARYPRDRNPLRSGYLLGPDKLQGQAAAVDAMLGKGHVILLGFRPQWRGQSHGAYRFFFNALYGVGR